MDHRLVKTVVRKAGRRCTHMEQDILHNLAEECAEVIQACTKILRFGPGNINPKTGESNLLALGEEVGNVLHCMDEAMRQKLTPFHAVDRGRREKAEKMPRYSRETGCKSDGDVTSGDT